MTGRVVSFDSPRGLGVIEGDDGSRHAFHCTEVADGSRSVPVGARVVYAVAPGVLGSWEATGIAVTSSG
jgi:cold shock CspA family protein